MPKYEVGADDTVSVPLKRPIREGGVEKAALKMRAPTVRDQWIAAKAAKTDDEREAVLFANLCEVTVDAVRGLRVADFYRLRRAFHAFAEEDAEEAQPEVGDADTVAVPLKRPVEDRGVPLPVLTMRAPTIGDQFDAFKPGKPPGESEAILFAKLCSVGADTLKGLRWSDYLKLQRVYTGFLAQDAEEAAEDGEA